PMDAYAHRVANRLLENQTDAATLEMTLQGAVLRFHCDCVIALAGADMAASVSGAQGERRLENWRTHAIARGDTLHCGRVTGAGSRAYLAVAGGFDTPRYLGSRATFTLGNFGGHGGRALRTGDVLKPHTATRAAKPGIEASAIPAYGNIWEIAVQYGP